MEAGFRAAATSLGQNREAVRQHNLSTVLNIARLNGTISRSQLAVTTGLNRSTISDLVAELAELGLALETEGAPASGAGRPSLIVLPSDEVVAFAVHPEVDATTVGLVTLSGKVLRKERVLMKKSPTPEDSIAVAAQTIQKLRESLSPSQKIAGVGVAVPGQVRVSDGVIRYAPQLNWVETAFGPALSQATLLPVYIANDASLGCMAERNFGSARGLSEVVFLFAGAGGIGGGAIVDGHQLRGTAGYAGELGHIRISSIEQKDYSGFAGTLEALVKRDELLEIFGLAVASDEELDDLIQKTQSPEAKALIEKQIDFLADGLSSFVTIFNPQAIVLGGFLTSLFTYDANRLLNRMRSGSVQASAERVLIRAGALGSNLMMIGAAELPFGALVREPSSYELVSASMKK